MNLPSIGFILLLIPAGNIYAAEENPFEALDAQLQSSFETLDSDLSAEYEIINAAIDQGFQKLRKEVEVVWGSDEVKLPEKHIWIDYSKDKLTRRIFDFAAETLTVEHLADPQASSESTSTQIKKAVYTAQSDTTIDLASKDDALKYALSSLAKSGVSLVSSNEKDPSKQKPILGDHLLISNRIISAIDAIVKEKTETVSNTIPQIEAPLSTRVVKDSVKPNKDVTVQPALPTDKPAIQKNSGEGQYSNKSKTRPIGNNNQRQSFESPSPAKISADYTTEGKRKITLTIPFQPDFMIARSEEFTAAVLEQAKRQGLKPSLIFAIMETESHFNPRARSPIPAFGLMQLVPASGGVDAYNYLFGEKTVLPPAYFFQADQNIELGVAYLKLLNDRYLKSIKNPLSRLYCTVAAYNTGAGNVARAFNGTKNIRKAARIINEMTPSQVHQHLIENLPYTETKNYLRKVFKAQNRYHHTDLAIKTAGG